MKKVSKFLVLSTLLTCFLLAGCSKDIKYEKQVIHTDNAPIAVGPYEQAIVIDKMVYCSGQIGLDPVSNILVEGGVEKETYQIFKNICAVLEAASSSLDNVVKSTVFLTDINDFTKVNEIYATYFKEGNYPARSAVEVSNLPKGASVEIEVVAFQN